jgi:hypothetical protein
MQPTSLAVTASASRAFAHDAPAAPALTVGADAWSVSQTALIDAGRPGGVQMNRLGFLGFLGSLGCLGFLSYLPDSQNLSNLYWLFVLFALFALFAVPTRKK